MHVSPFSLPLGSAAVPSIGEKAHGSTNSAAFDGIGSFWLGHSDWAIVDTARPLLHNCYSLARELLPNSPWWKSGYVRGKDDVIHRAAGYSASMAMSKRIGGDKQEDIWIAHTELARAPGHPFYERRPSLPPGVFFRALLIGHFAGIGAERGIAWGWRIRWGSAAVFADRGG